MRDNIRIYSLANMKRLLKKVMAALMAICSAMAFCSVNALGADDAVSNPAAEGKRLASNITLDGVRLSDYTYPLAYQLFIQRTQRLLQNFELKVIMNGSEYYLHAGDISFEVNTMDLFNKLCFSNEENAFLSTYSYDKAYVQVFADNIENDLKAKAPPDIGRPFIGYDLNTSTFVDQIHKKINDAISNNADHRAVLNIKSSPLYASPTPVPAPGPAPVSGNMLSTFTTYTTNVPNRNTNIRLACEILNGTKIAPGATFSFNRTLGYTSRDRGFLEAGILVNGVPDTGMGGGICQVSSTIYNVVLNAGLRVVERHPHSAPVGYVPVGRDATVSYGSADFRFQNNTSDVLTLVCTYNNRAVTVSLYKG